MGKPLVSVIMAAYNVGSSDILDLAIRSIIEQDMPSWELIICDDASTDGTYEHLMEWAARDARIHVLRNQTNRKSAVARNRCINEAQGEHIAIMDADDACTPNRLRVQTQFLSAHPEFSFVGLRGERFVQTPGDTNHPYWFCQAPQPKDFLMTLPFVHASIMFRRDAILAVNGYDETKRADRSEDYDMLLRIYEQGMRGVNIIDAVYYFREDTSAFRRRKYRYRLKEASVKCRGFSKLGLMPGALPYVVKPLIVGLIPVKALDTLKRRYYGNRSDK